MPFTLETNVTKENIPDDFLKDLTSLLAAMLDNPESSVCVQLKPGQNVLYGGSSDPFAFCWLGSIGGLSNETNGTHTQTIMNLIESSLNISKNRIYIWFEELATTDLGWNDQTIDEVLSS